MCIQPVDIKTDTVLHSQKSEGEGSSYSYVKQFIKFVSFCSYSVFKFFAKRKTRLVVV